MALAARYPAVPMTSAPPMRNLVRGFTCRIYGKARQSSLLELRFYQPDQTRLQSAGRSTGDVVTRERSRLAGGVDHRRHERSARGRRRESRRNRQIDLVGVRARAAL